MSANRDFSSEAAEKNDVINVPISKAKTTSDVVPSGLRSNTLPSSSQDKVQIHLNQWKKTEFSLTDKDLVEIQKDKHFMPMDFHEAIKAEAEEVESFVAGKYVEFYNYTGTAATTPYGSTHADSVNCRKVLNNNYVPKTDRTLIVDGEAGGNMLLLDTFINASKTNESGVIIDGEIGPKLGFNNIESENVPDHITGAAGTVLAVGAQTAAAATVQDGSTGLSTTTLAVDGLTNQPNVGDLFTIAGNTQSYTVVSSTTIASTASTLTIRPELAADVADNAALTFVGDHTSNLFFHRDAITYAERSLAITDPSGAMLASMTDAETGLSMRMEIVRVNKATVYEIDKLYGAKVTRDYAGGRLLG